MDKAIPQSQQSKQRSNSQQSRKDKINSQKKEFECNNYQNREKEQSCDEISLNDREIVTPIKSQRPIDSNQSKRTTSHKSKIQQNTNKEFNQTLTTTTMTKDSRDFMSLLRNKKDILYQQDIAEVEQMSKSIRTKLNTILSEQTDLKALKDQALPTIPKAYQGPIIASANMGKNQPICANDAHSKSTNNGFKRNTLGGFFAH